MNKELKKRLITSIILFITVIFCIFIHKIIFLISLFIISFICFDEWCNINYKHFSKKFWNYFLIKIFGLVYLFIFLGSAFLLRGSSYETSIFFTFILLICICSDIGGYFFGKTIGGKKLTKISPNKTVSGTIGSFIFSILPLFIFNLFLFDFDFSIKNILFCLTISLACQLGDLFISYFKRLNKVKNTGNFLPGHGGLLDRIDGIIFAIPVAIILKSVQVF